MAAQYVAPGMQQMALPGQVQPTDFMAQRVAELTHEKAAMTQELALTKKQLHDASENIVVLEEGQVFLLQKHKQIVSDYHTKLRKAEEESKQAIEKAQNEAKLAIEQVSQLQQMQQPAPLMDPAKVEVAQLLGVIEDLQRAIDEKNELIDLLSLQLTDLQRQSEHGKQRITETEAALASARFEVSELVRRLQSHGENSAAAPTPVQTLQNQSVDLESLTALLDRRDSQRAAQLRVLTDDVSHLRAQLTMSTMAPPPPPVGVTQLQSISSLGVAPIPLPVGSSTLLPSTSVGISMPSVGIATTPLRSQPHVAVAATIPMTTTAAANIVQPRVTSPRRTPSPLSRVAHLTSSDLPLRTGMTLPPRARAIFSPPKPP